MSPELLETGLSYVLEYISIFQLSDSFQSTCHHCHTSLTKKGGGASKHNIISSIFIRNFCVNSCENSIWSISNKNIVSQFSLDFLLFLLIFKLCEGKQDCNVFHLTIFFLFFKSPNESVIQLK